VRSRLLGRRWEEYLLLLVSATAGAVAVVTAPEAVSARPVLSAATALALALSLVSACVFWLAGATRSAAVQTRPGDDDAARRVLASLPDGLVLLDGHRVASVNRAFCELVGYARDELVGAEPPFPFWPPEHKHELERWQAQLSAGEARAEQLTFLHRDGSRIPVLVAGSSAASLARQDRQVLTVRDVSHGYRRERRLAELCWRDPETALLDERGFDQRIRDAVRSALADGTNPSVVVVELGSDGPRWSGGLRSPEALLVIDRLQGLLRAGDELARMGGEQIAWLLPESGLDGAVEAVSRARRAISDTGTTLTAGVCDFATAGDAPSLYALADQALAEAKRQGRGTTASYTRGIPEILPSDAEHRARS
jgi:PAS domain S-box-containing protein